VFEGKILRTHFNATFLFSFCSRNKFYSSPKMVRSCIFSTMVQYIQFLLWCLLPCNGTYNSPHTSHSRLPRSLSGPCLIPEGKRSHTRSWSAHCVCQCRQLHQIQSNTRPGIKNALLCSLACRCGPGMSSCKGIVMPISSFCPYLEHTLPRLQYQKKYHSLLNALRKGHAGSSQHDVDPLDIFPGTRALLREREEDAVPLSAEDAIDYLLEAAIERFGYSARDVFNGVFDYQATTLHHQEAFAIKYADLQAAVSALPKSDPHSLTRLSRPFS